MILQQINSRGIPVKWQKRIFPTELNPINKYNFKISVLYCLYFLCRNTSVSWLVAPSTKQTRRDNHIDVCLAVFQLIVQHLEAFT